MVNLSPDTDTKKTWSSGYLYESDSIRGFSHIHAWQLAGISVLPTTGAFKGHLGSEEYRSSFTHDGEIAKPGYHKVYLKDYGITAEHTATTRVGFHRYTFEKQDDKSILFDLGAYLAHGPTVYSKSWVVGDQEIAGMQVLGKTIRRPKDTPVYFVARVDQAFEEIKGWVEGKLLEKMTDTVQGKDAGMAMSFGKLKDDKVLLKVGISYVSVEQARKNLDKELGHWDFDRIVAESDEEWNTLLNRIEVSGGTHEQKVKFYTDLWRSLLGRRIISDVDGKYTDFTQKRPITRQVALDDEGNPRFPHYNFDAWWGSHWSLNILWSLAYPEIMDGFCNTMVDMYENGGLIPRGPSGGNYTFVMIGDPSVPFFATAYNKGIRNYDVEKAYEGLRKNAFVGGIRDHAGYEHQTLAFGGGMSYYEKQGWVPEGIEAKGGHRDGASMTLEYAYEDWCLAQLAKALGKSEDYDLFSKRSLNYKNLWNPKSKMMHPREKDGSWIKDFKLVEKEFNARGFCESNSAVYTHFVPHDVVGLAELFGGTIAYTNALDEQFKKGQASDFVSHGKKHASSWVDYGNQPGTAMAHMFNRAGAPWLSQKWVRKVKEVFEDTSPYGGYDGDEDQGQMGALGVLMAIGLFEVDGGAAEKPSYEITSPIFDKVTIKLNRDYYPGEQFVIETKNNSRENMYIQSATLNDKSQDNCWFYHEDLVKGGRLRLEMGSKPNKKWGSNPENLPPSLSRINR